MSSLLARTYAERGRRVVAVDTDSNPNLGLSLGLDLETVEALPALPRSIVVGRGGDCELDELFDTYGVATPSGVTVMSALRVTEAGAGCTCGGHRTVRSLLGEALDEHADVTIVDMEAGIEHLSRSGGTLAHADILVIVMDPSRKSVVTAARTITLAEELGIARCIAVGNKAVLPATPRSSPSSAPSSGSRSSRCCPSIPRWSRPTAPVSASTRTPPSTSSPRSAVWPT